LNYEVKVDKMSRTSGSHGEKRNSYRIPVAKPEEKNHREDLDEYNIKMEH
jgi:hypothetical protein